MATDILTKFPKSCAIAPKSDAVCVLHCILIMQCQVAAVGVLHAVASDVASALPCLACVCQAEEFFLESLDIRIKALGPDDPMVANTLFALGMFYGWVQAALPACLLQPVSTVCFLLSACTHACYCQLLLLPHYCCLFAACLGP